MKFHAILGLILSKFSHLKVIWKKWDIRSFLISSFVFQLILILSAPFRKRSSNLFTRITLWISYLLADWVAAQAVGLITRATEPGDCLMVSQSQAYLFAFWAQFLLVHLGGPDTITALALEDNELWLRTALHLGTQIFTSLGVLLRSTQVSGLWCATLMMFVVGIVKYLERVMSLFHGRLMDGINEDPRKHIVHLLGKQCGDDELWPSHSGDVEGQMKRDVPRLTNVEMVRGAFSLFHCHKRLFVDRKLRREVRESTRQYFMRRTEEEAYQLLEMELNFAYEAIYTKTKVLQKPAWKMLRHAVFWLQVAALVMWCFTHKKEYPGNDIRITNTLLGGAIAVDVLAFLRIHLSDWSIAGVDEKGWWANWRIEGYNKLLAARTHNWKEAVPPASSLSISRSWFRRVFLGRWSEYIYIFDVENIGTKSRVLDKMAGCLGLDIQNNIIILRRVGVIKKGLPRGIWDLIYEAVRGDYGSSSWETKIYKMKGNGKTVNFLSLVDEAVPTTSLEKNYLPCVEPWFTKDPFSDVEEDIEESKDDQTANLISLRKEISSILRGYLHYLMIFQTDMVYGAAGKERILALMEPEGNRYIDSDDGDIEEAAERKRVIEKMLNEIEYQDEKEKEIVRWELIARVMVKLLCYAAIKCRPDVHAKKLKEGGEFLSFVWLLMVNFNVTKA